ncbi:hypothetical protein EAG_05263 [Camponotus floridanus]|uniref:Uncharacterized protein n=1 Tax=Camponotus floridanus TaxID=104421 RepID=E2A8C7_CAMFO|nr:hypothetical protein EAG_05263 [Camponotus floridanus]
MNAQLPRERRQLDGPEGARAESVAHSFVRYAWVELDRDLMRLISCDFLSWYFLVSYQIRKVDLRSIGDKRKGGNRLQQTKGMPKSDRESQRFSEGFLPPTPPLPQGDESSFDSFSQSLPTTPSEGQGEES